MTLYLALPTDLLDYAILEDSKKEALGPAKDKKKWVPHEFDCHILAYARKDDIELTGRKNLDELIEEVESGCEAELPTPESNSSTKADVWGFGKKLKAYEKDYAGITALMAGKEPKVPIAGDALDITSWTSAAWKAKTFDGKDPLSERDIDAIKQEMVMWLA